MSCYGCSPGWALGAHTITLEQGIAQLAGYWPSLRWISSTGSQQCSGTALLYWVGVPTARDFAFTFCACVCMCDRFTLIQNFLQQFYHY